MTPTIALAAGAVVAMVAATGDYSRGTWVTEAPHASELGSALDCESIRDPDQRHLCRAEAKRDPTECELIRDHDLRALCRARVKR